MSILAVTYSLLYCIIVVREQIMMRTSQMRTKCDQFANEVRTACEQLAFQTVASIKEIIKNEKLSKASYRLLPTGGGVFNSFLMEMIQEYCDKEISVEIDIPEEKIISFKGLLKT